MTWIATNCEWSASGWSSLAAWIGLGAGRRKPSRLKLGPKHDIFDRMILSTPSGDKSGDKFGWRRAALAVAILTLAGATWLPAQKTAKPLNVDGKVLRDTGSLEDPL